MGWIKIDASKGPNSFLTWIIHQEIWRWTTQHTVEFRRVVQTKIKFSNMTEC